MNSVVIDNEVNQFSKSMV